MTDTPDVPSVARQALALSAMLASLGRMLTQDDTRDDQRDVADLADWMHDLLLAIADGIVVLPPHLADGLLAATQDEPST